MESNPAGNSDFAPCVNAFPQCSLARMTKASHARANVLGVGLSALNLPLATRLIIEAARRGRKGYVTVTGVHGVMEAQRDDEFKRILNRSFLTTPDGMPMTWVGRAQGYREMDRVYGPDLMLDIFRQTADGSVRHFFYGGKEGVAERLRQKLEATFPGVVVCGTYTPPFRALTAEEENALVETLAGAKPHILWIGLSTPKQERFMHRYLDRLPVPIMIGVGAAFDIHAGLLQQAPRWMQRIGLEWFFRLCTEPRRLWRRYLINNPAFVYAISLQLAGIRRYELPV
jgi:N-acetylglucosaminyldiphosphoundecaprenol N-acetyl-beta-D-mannosaminyltransferase